MFSNEAVLESIIEIFVTLWYSIFSYNKRRKVYPLLKSERKLIDWMIKRKDILLFLIVTCMAILARIPGLDYISEDMTDHLLPWAEQFRANPGFSAMRSQIGDYNILYQTLIVLICRLPGSMVYLYKYISIFCDFLLAVICGELVRKVKGGTAFCPAFAVTYAIVLFVPTVILNSAVWGQCDAMYTCVCILALAALYRRRYVASFIALGIAFALKLQTIFILPVYLYVYICRKDFSLLHFFISIFTLWVTGIPAYLEGRSLLTVFQIYLNQVNEYPLLVMNSPSIWTLFFPGYAYMRLCALITTVLILGLFLYHLLNHKQVIREDPESYLILAAWCTWTCFLFLPSMHERYSYLSDLLLVLLALLSRKYLPYALVAVCISGITYTNYLQDYTLWRVIPYLTPITAGAWFAFTFRILPASLTLDKHCTNQETKEYLP